MSGPLWRVTNQKLWSIFLFMIEKYSSVPDIHIKGSWKSSVHYVGSYTKIKWHFLTMKHHLHIPKHGQTLISGRSVSHVTYKYKNMYFLHYNVHNTHNSTYPQNMHSIIICGMNSGKRCLFSTHLHLETFCIIGNVLTFKITNKWNTLSSLSGKSLSLMKREFSFWTCSVSQLMPNQQGYF